METARATGGETQGRQTAAEGVEPCPLRLFRHGSKRAKALNMYMRPRGATNAEITAALGQTHLNMLKVVEGHGHTVVKSKVIGPNGRMVTAYRVVPKGTASQGSG